MICLVVGLAGCSTIDHFGPRTIQINRETSDAKSRAIFANILRAASGRPLQFTDVTTVSGTGTFEGSLAASLPVAVTPSTVDRTFNLTPTLTASANNTFNVANLNTQEFYNGLQTPVSVQHIANFIASGYDPQLVLFLTVRQINVKSADRRMVFNATAATDLDYKLFYQALSFLLDAGLSTRAGDEKEVGPDLSPDRLRDPRVVAAVLGSSDKGVSIGGKSKDSGQYHLVKDGGYKFCFDPIALSQTSPFQPHLIESVQGLKSLQILHQKVLPSTLTASLVRKDEHSVEGASTFVITSYDYCDPPEGTKKPKEEEDFTLATRSVEGIFQFLGDIARRQIAEAKPETAIPLLAGRSDGTLIFPFRVVTGRPENAALTIIDKGNAYSIVTDVNGKGDQSTRVIQILTDLLALQSSAKDLPAPNLISVISR